jgi:hypothetical protein
VRNIGRTLEDGRLDAARRFSKEHDCYVAQARLDEELVAGAVKILRAHGARPHVDASDETLGGESPIQAAQTVRERIAKCGRVVVLMTDRAPRSTWTPWLVGLADGVHKRTRVALFPMLDTGNAEEWAKHECLAIYPRVELHVPSGETDPIFVVVDPADGEHWVLERWLALGKPGRK